MPYSKPVIIKYKKTTISVKNYLLSDYSEYICRKGKYIHRKNYYQDNKKLINMLIREELNKKNITTNLSQYVDYWLYQEIKRMIYLLLNQSEDRNKSQRETLKNKYSILEKDELLKKIDA